MRGASGDGLTLTRDPGASAMRPIQWGVVVQEERHGNSICVRGIEEGVGDGVATVVGRWRLQRARCMTDAASDASCNATSRCGERGAGKQDKKKKERKKEKKKYSVIERRFRKRELLETEAGM